MSEKISMDSVGRVVNEISSLGINFFISGCEDWTVDDVIHAIDYARSGGLPVKERHTIMAAILELKGYSSGFQIDSVSDRAIAERVINGGCWKINEEVKSLLQRKLNESDRRKTYEFRRDEANRHIAKRNVRKRIFERDGGCCCLCGSSRSLSIDHVYPVVNGGTDDDENLQTLCVSCNSRKGSFA